MGERVFFIKAEDNEDDSLLCTKLEHVIQSQKLLDFIKDRDVTAIKTHFGEVPQMGFARPLYIKMLGNLIKRKGAMPFLTETSTLYKGNRNNAIKHIAHANAQGFGFKETGMPIIMADGLYGDEDYDVPIEGKIYKSVKIAALFAKCNALIMVSHFTGHLGTGFGAALKNMGMGCSSRAGKMDQHSTTKPSVNKRVCTGCGVCVKWCSQKAITLKLKETAVIDKDKCIGCGQCLAMCRFDAIKYNWSAAHEDLQKKIVEHAMGLYNLLKNKSLFINVLTRISKDCDCMNEFEKIVPDIGLLVSTDPVALDSASLNLVESKSGMQFSKLAYDIPYRFQIDYSKELNFGNSEYELVEM